MIIYVAVMLPDYFMWNKIGKYFTNEVCEWLVILVGCKLFIVKKN